jgi:histidinol dehydrogenase
MRLARVSWDGMDPAEIVDGIRAKAPPPPGLAKRVAEIIAAVREGGDEALNELIVHLDGVVERPESHRVPDERLADARAHVHPELIAALELAAANVRAVAEAELDDPPLELDLPQGQSVALVERPVGAAGIYAPGGRAAYPSSVLMGCVPARAAGVERVALATPPEPDGSVGTVTLAAAAIAGADEVYALGGAHGIAALALGTDSIDPVDVVAGPGNAWVTEAKRQLFGVVGIDGLAGPSELAVVLDGNADVAVATMGLLAQAEHGADSPLVAISHEPAPLDAIAKRIGPAAGERPSVADAPLALVDVPTLDAALKLSDALAPEHLELHFDGADTDVAKERVAGCVFIGDGATTAFGDYAAGSNHVLPTGGAARFSGPLDARTFVRRTSVVTLDHEAATALAPTVDEIAKAEGLPVHGESARVRATRKTR